MYFYKKTSIILTILIGACLFCFKFKVKAQSKNPADTSSMAKDLSEIVVTATRSDRKLNDVPVPVSIIGKEQIQSSGSSRLDEILSEQTGLAIIDDHGFGVQMQGMNPEYSLILVNGEPVIGRTAGTLDLTRISLNDVERIEIIKGPSSSLYGSDALAGVINIITKKRTKSGFRLRSKYGSNRTSDNTIAGTIALGKKGAASLSANRYETAGYDLMPQTYGKTIDPYTDYTLRGNLNYQITSKLKAELNGHYFSETQKNNYLVNTTADSIVVKGKGKVEDKRISPVFTYKFSPKWKLKLRNYWSQYKTQSDLIDHKADTAYEDTYFRQDLWKEELQSENILNQHQVLTLGAGFTHESLDASRYDAGKSKSNYFLYAQHEWHPTAAWSVLTGLRLDVPSDYRSQLSPKLAAQYALNKQWKFRASVGMGYKAPDFRQLYLDFSNQVIGYAVLGTKVTPAIIEKMQQEGQIVRLHVDDLSELSRDLKPESSVAYNIGATYKGETGWELEANLFRNDIKDLIDTRIVALKRNGMPLYSYYNIHRVFTEGTEINGHLPFFDNKLNISAGYQFLIARDKDVVQKIKAGKAFKNNPVTGKTERLKMADYGGLFNRSRHTFNLKVYYHHKSWYANARLLYRGRFGFVDIDGGGILDAENEYTPGYALLHLDVAKKCWTDRLKIEAGIKDLLDYKDPKHLPYVPGRTWYISASLHLSKKRN